MSKQYKIADSATLVAAWPPLRDIESWAGNDAGKEPGAVRRVL
jgi:hypothetical protein